MLNDYSTDYSSTEKFPQLDLALHNSYVAIYV